MINPVRDKKNPRDLPKRVDLGGAWSGGTWTPRMSFRYFNYPVTLYSDVGFRLVRNTT